MSNILYRMQVKPQENPEKLMIDSNEILEECIEERQKIALERKRMQAVSEDDEQGDLTADGSETNLEGEDGFSPLSEMPLPEAEPEEPQIDYVAQAQAEAENILEDARGQAQDIISQAQEQAEAIKSHAEAEGQKSGYDQGLQQAYQMQSQWEAEAQELKKSLQEEDQQKQQSMEKEIASVVCDVVEKVFLVQFGDQREIIFHLVDNALSNIESSKEFLIRVNEANCEFLKGHKAELQEKVGQDVLLDIVLDPLLDDSQCMIETDGGLFDCGMDTQMKNLIKDIKSLS